MGEYLSFDKLITPTLVRLLFWLGLAIVVIYALGLIFGGYFFSGLGVLIFGPLGVRVYCEILIVIFQINNTLTEIRDHQIRNAPAVPPAPAS